MKRSEMYYAEPIYRPPSEHSSLLIQATVGCSAAAAGKCHFCNSNIFKKMYPEKRFRIRPTDEILEDITIAGNLYGPRVEKIFFLDSNAMIMKTQELLTITRKCYALFPMLKQVACYSCAGDILRKSPRELIELREAGLNLVYIGLESGDQKILDLINKGTTVVKQIDAVLKAKQAGLRTSVSVILGLGGQAFSEQHAIKTGEAVTAMNPDYLAALTLMIDPGTVLDEMVKKKTFKPITDPLVFLKELQLIILNTNAPGPVVFRSNHVSNYLQLRGNLPADKVQMLNYIQDTMAHPERLSSRPYR
ncbi:radical SAM protein [Desulfocicer niacini]